MSWQAPVPLCVFGPNLHLEIMVEPREQDDEFDDLHLHPGGQGFWIARMAGYLGADAQLVSPIGGEAGHVLRGLVNEAGIELNAVETQMDSPTSIQDRRSGERVDLAASPPMRLDRHELDDLYGLMLETSLSAGFSVVSGRVDGDLLPLDIYRRLGADLGSTGVTVIGDLHGQELDAFLDGGPIAILKVSDEDLIADGALARDPADHDVRDVIASLVERGAEGVIVSSATRSTIARLGGRSFVVDPPQMDPIDHRGSGDAMTAGMAVGSARGYDPIEILQLGAAAGAANVTRHGLASARPGLVEGLIPAVRVTES